MTEEIETINKHYSEGLRLKDIARKDDRFLKDYKKASDNYFLAAEKVEELLKKIDDKNINFITRSNALKNYYLYEAYECLYGYKYKKGIYDEALECAQKAKEYIKNAIEIVDISLEKLNDETKNFLIEQKGNWRLSELTVKLREVEPIGQKAMKEKDFITALDSYRKMDELQDKAHNYVENSTLPQVFKRTEKGNYFAMKASIAMSLAGVYIAKSENNNYLKDIVEQFLTALEYISQAQEINPEQDRYKEGKEITTNNIKKILKENPENWDILYYSFEDNKLFNNIMKETDIKKFNEIELKRKLDLNENKGKKLLVFGGFWLSVFIILMSSITTLFLLNIPWWTVILIVLLVQFAYALISATVLRNLGDLSEKGLLEIYKLTIKYNFNLFNSNKPKNI